MRLTEAQRRMLVDAERMPGLGFDGVVGKGARGRMAVALLKAGLLHYVGHGEEADGDGFSLGRNREWPIYAITDAGLAALTPTPEADAPGNHEPEVKE
jgi:hypothetical protein